MALELWAGKRVGKAHPSTEELRESGTQIATQIGMQICAVVRSGAVSQRIARGRGPDTAGSANAPAHPRKSSGAEGAWMQKRDDQC